MITLTNALLMFLALSPLHTYANAIVPTNSSLSASIPKVTTLHEFPAGTYVENIAIRSNGDLIVVLLDKPEVHTINPHTGTTTLLHIFPHKTRVTGIAEIRPDVFAVITVKLLLDLVPTSPWEIWSLDLNGPSVEAKLISEKIKGVTVELNGLILLNEKTLLASDTIGGKIWKIDIAFGNAEILLPAPGQSLPLFGFGLNGIRLLGSTFYYSNTLKGLARVPIDLQTGLTTGPAEVLSNEVGFDDFSFSPLGDAVFAADQASHEVLRVEAMNPFKATAVAGGTEPGTGGFVGPTCTIFGRTSGLENTLFVTTAGRALLFNGPVDGGKGGKVIRVDLG